MAGESQAVTFSTEQEKADAIDAYEGSNEGELDAIMEAKIVEKPVEESVPEEGDTPEPKPEPVEPEIKPPDTEKPDVEKPVEDGVKPEETDGKPFTVNKEDLPEQYKTPGQAFKAVGEKEKLIVKQADYIKGMNEKHEAELAELRKQPDAPVV